MRHKQIGSAVCRRGSKCIGISFAQMWNEQFSKKITRPPTSIRHTTNDVSRYFSLRWWKIRAHWMKIDSFSFNFLTVKRRCCNHRSVTALLQFQRKRHERMEVAKGAPSGKNHS